MKRRHKKRFFALPDTPKTLKRYGTNINIGRDLVGKKENWICRECGFASRQFTPYNDALFTCKCPMHGDTMVNCGMATDIPRTGKKRAELANRFVAQKLEREAKVPFNKYSSKSLE